MKKKYILIAIAIIGILSWSQTTSASLITPLGTVDYNDYLQVDIVFPAEVNLTYVYSSIDEDVLVMDKLSYIPATNTTRYLFTSELYFPEYLEQINQEPFIFQDTTSKDLYVVIINMSGIEIPDDPWEIDYLNLSEEYNITCQELEEALFNLTEISDELDEWINDF